MKPDKLKVIWICGFTNAAIQEKLKPWRKIGEIAPWITNLIPLFENCPDIELHVISTHLWIPYTKSFKHNGIHYHFVCQGIPLIGKSWPSFFPFDLWSDYYLIKGSVKSLVNTINPDIIHLHGAENTYHTPAILQFRNKFPILVTLQGFLHKVAAKSDNLRIMRRVEREQYIYRNFSNFGYRTETMQEVVKEFNPNAKLHYHGFIQNIPLIKEPNDSKQYDIVYFGRIIKIKGVEDLFSAIALVKKKKSDIKILIIGNSGKDYLQTLNKIASDLNIKENITWTGFLPTQSDVHRLVSNAKVSVLPSHYDMIPGTIIESMFLKLPVVSYRAGSIPEINEHEEIIKLVEVGDINGLADAIYQLISDKEMLYLYAEKGYKRATEMFNNSIVKSDLLKAYSNVIKDFKQV